jgi:hypothetical protein
MTSYDGICQVLRIPDGPLQIKTKKNHDDGLEVGGVRYGEGIKLLALDLVV